MRLRPRSSADPDCQGNAKKNPFSVAQYKETYEASSEIIKDDEGEMFEQGAYIDHVCTRKTNRMTPLEAAKSWEDMLANKDRHYSDKGGTGGAIRFRVSLRDLVIFRDRFAHKRGAEVMGKQLKNPDELGIQKLRDSVVNGSASSDQKLDLFAIGQAMVSSSGGMDFDVQDSQSWTWAQLLSILLTGAG